jgi:hypothetical protein
MPSFAAAAVAFPALASILNACGKAKAAAAPIARPNPTAATSRSRGRWPS